MGIFDYNDSCILNAGFRFIIAAIRENTDAVKAHTTALREAHTETLAAVSGCAARSKTKQRGEEEDEAKMQEHQRSEGAVVGAEGDETG